MTAEGKPLECRIVITYWPGVYTGQGAMFDLGMYDPLSMRYERLGRHPLRDAQKIIGDLKRSIETAGHLLTFSEVTGPR